MNQSTETTFSIYREALQKSYVGCLFDIDGTLTVRGDEYIPAFMHEVLANMCMRVPMAVCTARNLKDTYEKMAPVFTRAGDPVTCQQNFIFICENGCIGYFYDKSGKEYKEFYRIPYPYAEAHRENVFSRINSAIGNKLGVSFMKEVSMVFRPVRTDDPDREALAGRSREIVKIIESVLEITDPKRALKIGDSGIGVNVFPYTGNKEQGTLKFAEFIRTRLGMNVDENAKELIVVGDQPGPYGNDETFLNGKYGTPFTVGELHPQNPLPLPVFDLDRKTVLKGPEGTIYLLKNLKFKTL